ncbi:MAG: YdaU family protein [Synechococcaceae cyanobacterium SM1_2_3]|nr:YdaU family protein [Synechococcaceae cyanobacterium SM1_2_3]
MNGLPYYPRYPRDFFDGTNGMTFELKGAYAMLLDLIYMCGGQLYDEPRFIAGHMNCSVRAWGNYRAALIERGKITVENGIISNFRADKEMIIQRSFQDKQRINASGPRKNNDLDKATAEPKPSHTDTHTEEEKREAKASPKKTRGTRLPQDWFLPLEWGEWALSEGMSREVIRVEADKFKDYWNARAGPNGIKLDWQATWRNWIRAAKERGHGNGNHGGGRLSQGGKRPDPALAQIARLTGIDGTQSNVGAGVGSPFEEGGSLWVGSRPQQSGT